MKVALLAAVMLGCVGQAASEERIRLTTWNIANFWHVPGKYLRPARNRGPGLVRTKRDYDRIRAVLAKLDADIIGLQEIGHPDGVALLFPHRKYGVVFSHRYADDLRADPSKINDPAKRDIYTAIVYRKSKVRLLRRGRIKALAIAERGNDGVIRSTREGTTALLQVGSQKFWVASIHLKSGCQRVPNPVRYKNPRRPYTERACRVLLQQLPHLERWIDNLALKRTQFVLLGDFNRVLDRGSDVVRRELDDGDPPGLKLYKAPHRQKFACSAHGRRPESSIDYIVISKGLWQFADKQKRPRKIDVSSKRVSDHCPVFWDLWVKN